MVSSTYVGGLVSRAVFLMSTNFEPMDKKTYVANTVDAVDSLQNWYNAASGLYDSTGWWNSANAITALADFARVAPAKDTVEMYNIPWIIQNTFTQAQKTKVTAQKNIAASGMTTSTYYFETPLFGGFDVEERGFDNFINEYYDDEGWWALALIRSYDLGAAVSSPQQYLDAAVTIFEDMKGGQSTCGGIYWSKTTKYTNAIANELYLSVAASLANRIPSRKGYFLDIAKNQWTWFKNTGMINEKNLINDGLTADCVNNGEPEWTYNQGVILGGLVELWKATGDASYLDEAMKIANAAIAYKSKDGILWEGCEPDCGSDGAQFKGAFIRNLKYLHAARPNEAIQNYLLRQADSIWATDRNAKSQLGPTWMGPFFTASAGTHSSALDALVAAVMVR